MESDVRVGVGMNYPALDKVLSMESRLESLGSLCTAQQATIKRLQQESEDKDAKIRQMLLNNKTATVTTDTNQLLR